jgi:2-polyprenyl-6-methoxyphenol hydroxylase-like FAD-dependent oxidoreductase
MGAARVRVAVIGAGIGGLTAAIALRRAGLEVEIFEQAPEIREVGAGITVQCNAVTALAELGLAERARALGHEQKLFRVCDASGRLLYEARPETILATAPQLAMHRATLQAMLLDAAGRERVHTGKRCTGFEPSPSGVRARFDDGAETEADVLVGADGIHSAVRAQLLGDTPPRYAGYTGWRGVCRRVTDRGELWPPGVSTEAWGRGRRFGIVPIDDARLYWYATRNAAAGAVDATPARAHLFEIFAGWFDPVAAILEATAETSILRNDILDRPPVERWGEGRVTLLGDAAHPMTPNLGQGGCQAIEDAVVLGRTLGHAAKSGSDLAAALRGYEAARRPRTRWIVEQSWRLGHAAQWENAWARAARDAGLRALAPLFIARSMRRAWTFAITGRDSEPMDPGSAGSRSSGPPRPS